MDERVLDALGSQFETVEPVRQIHAVPPHAVYEVVIDGRRAVCKADTGPAGSAAMEGHVTALVGAETSLPVPEVLAVGEDFYVAAWHPDAPAPDAGQPADAAWAHGAGRALGTLHAETAGCFDGYGLLSGDAAGLEHAGRSAWHAAARDYLERRREAIAPHGHADVADAAIELLEAHPDRFDGVGDPVLCHGFATPDHLAVADGEPTCLLDFEHAIVAPPGFDYWRTVLPAFDLGAGGRSGPHRAFDAGYAAVRPMPVGSSGAGGSSTPAALFRLLTTVYYLESLHVQDRHGPEETADRADWLRETVFESLEDLRERLA